MLENNFTKRCDQVSIAGFCMLIFFLPISIALIEWSFGFIFLSFLIKRAYVFNQEIKKYKVFNKNISLGEKIILFLESFKPVPNTVNKSIGFYILIAFVSVLISCNPAQSLKAFFCKLLEDCYFFFIFIEVINSLPRLRIILCVFSVSILVVTLNGLVQFFHGTDLIHGFGWGDGRIVSCFKHSNDYGAYLVIVIMMLLGILMTHCFVSKEDRQSWKIYLLEILTLLLLILSLTNLGLTFSRGAWVGFGGAMLFFAFWRPKFLWLNIFIIGAFFIFFQPLMILSRNVNFNSDFTYNVQGKNLSDKEHAKSKNFQEWFHRILEERFSNFSGMGRIYYWQEAMHVIKHRPIFGNGLNTYALLAPKYKIYGGIYPHNCYLQMAAEVGIVGLLAFGWIIWSIFQSVRRFIRQSQDKFLSSLALGVLSGFFGFLVHSAFDTQFYSVQLSSFMWLIMGMLAALPKIGTTLK